MDLLAERNKIWLCTLCPLYKRVQAPVPWRGPCPSELAIIGEAPGRTEDDLNKPFVGASGQLLAKYLDKAGLDIEDFMIFNTVQCNPNGSPPAEAIEACSVHRKRQLQLSEARFVLVLGAVALSVTHPNPEARITKVRGEPWTKTVKAKKSYTRTYFATYHPAAVLRNRTYTRTWREDFETFAELTESR